MLRIEINKSVSRKWLTKELQAAGVRVYSVVQNEGESVGYTEIEEADEALALQVIQAHNPNNNPEVTERNDLAGLYNDIEAEVTWIDGAIPRVAQLKAVFDSSTSTQAQVKAAGSGLCDLIDRLLREQKREFKDGWKYVARRLK